MVELLKVESSTVEAVGHDPASLDLHVHFVSGDSGIYKKVPVELYGRFLSSESKGSFLHREIKPVYEFESRGRVSQDHSALVYDLVVACPKCNSIMQRNVLKQGNGNAPESIHCTTIGCKFYGRLFKAPARRVELEEMI